MVSEDGIVIKIGGPNIKVGSNSLLWWREMEPVIADFYNFHIVIVVITGTSFETQQASLVFWLIGILDHGQ